MFLYFPIFSMCCHVFKSMGFICIVALLGTYINLHLTINAQDGPRDRIAELENAIAWEDTVKRYHLTNIRVVDGDTIYGDIELGWDLILKQQEDTNLEIIYVKGLLENNSKTGQKGAIKRLEVLEDEVEGIKTKDKVRVGKATIAGGFVGGVVVFIGKIMLKLVL